MLTGMGIQLQQFVQAVDAFMPLPKILVGAESPTWQPGRDVKEARLKLPLEVGDEHYGFLVISAFPEHPTLNFTLGLMLSDYVVCRLDFDQEARHGNNLRPRHPDCPSIVEGPHWHSWEVNRSAITSLAQKLPLCNAVPFKGIRQFDAALRWYCDKRKIELGSHGIVYPNRQLLI